VSLLFWNDGGKKSDNPLITTRIRKSWINVKSKEGRKKVQTATTGEATEVPVS
jgi:hypothetical protein